MHSHMSYADTCELLTFARREVGDYHPDASPELITHVTQLTTLSVSAPDMTD